MVGRGAFLIICCGILACSCGEQPAGPEDAGARARRAGALFPVHHNGKYGYIDNTGRLVIRPRFDYAARFSEGLARVGLRGESGYIDSTGEMVIKGLKGSGGRFSEGLARIEVKTDSGRKHGYIDRTGKLVIEPRFDAARDFSEGLAAVKVGEKWGGYIDRTGRLVIEPRFDIASLSLARFSEGFACVKVGEKRGYIDRSGKMVIEPRFDACHPFSEGLAEAAIWHTAPRGQSFGYIDKTSQYVIPQRFARCRGFSEGLAKVSVGEKVFDKKRLGSFFKRTKAGYIDKTGKFIIEPRFTYSGSFSEGLALAQERVGLYGYIDRTGTFVIKPQFGSDSKPFSGGLAQVTFGGKGARYTGHCYVDRSGRFIWPITSPRYGAALLEGFKGDAWATDWWLRFRVVDPEGKPVPGVQVWTDAHGDALQVMSQSLPIAWWDIGERGTGTARAKRVNWTKASEFVSGADGIIRMGPFRGPAGFNVWGDRCALYHPDYATVHVRADPKKHKPEQGVIDLGDVKLSRGCTITGVVTGPDGRPVENAWVAAQPFYKESGDSDNEDIGIQIFMGFGLRVGTIRTARTDAEGRYTLRGLVPARLVVAAWNGVCPPATQVVDFSPIALDKDPAGNRNADLALRKGETMTVVALEGDDPGMPVPDAEVEVKLCGAESIGLANWGGLTAFEGKTGEDGKLVVVGLPGDAEFTVWVSSPKGGRWCSDRTGPGETETARFLYGPLKLKVESDGGAPVQGFRYWFECTDSGRESRGSESRGIHAHYRGGSVDSDALEIPALIQGTWEVRVAAAGHHDTRMTFEVTQDGHEAMLRLKPATGVLKGRVVDEDTGRPMVGIDIRATYLDWHERNRPTWMKAATDDDGRFVLNGLGGTASRLRFRIEHPGYIPVEDIPVKHAWWDEKEGHDLGEIALARACTVHGVLTEAGRPAPNRLVQLWSTDGVIQYHGHVETGPGGKWRRENLKPGRYLVVYCGARKSVEVRPGPPADAGTLETNDIWEPAGR